MGSLRHWRYSLRARTLRGSTLFILLFISSTITSAGLSPAFAAQRGLPSSMRATVAQGPNFSYSSFTNSNSLQESPFVHDPVLFIHGISAEQGTLVQNVFLGGPTNCSTYFGKAMDYLKYGIYRLGGNQTVQWLGPVTSIGYYYDDTNCDVNLSQTNGSAQWMVDANQNCPNYYHVQTHLLHLILFGTNNDLIEHLACIFAWYIHDTYTAHGQNVDVVDHSMGGLITRWAISQSRSPTDVPSKIPTTGFPQHKLLVRDVVSFDSPFNGDHSANDAVLVGQGGNETIEMRHNSQFVQALKKDMYPQGANGTNWTLIGNKGAQNMFPNPGVSCANVEPSSATDMSAGYKVWYVNPCYRHTTFGGDDTPFNDAGDGTDAVAEYCTKLHCQPSKPKVSYPHALCRMLDALIEIPVDPVYGASGGCYTLRAGICVPFSDPFNGTVSLSSVWTETDPTGASVQTGDTATIPGLALSVMPGVDLYPGTNFNAPRFLQLRGGSSYTLETEVEVDPAHEYQGAGILIWQDQNNFIRLERGFGGTSSSNVGVRLDIDIGGSYSSISPTAFNQTNSTDVGLKIQRSGNNITAWWRDAAYSVTVPNGYWHQLGQTPFAFSFASNSLMQVGIDVINYPYDGTGGPADVLNALFNYFSVICG